MSDRRNFLKLFGVSSAAMVTAAGNVETHTDATAPAVFADANAHPVFSPVHPSAPLHLHAYLDVRPGLLYSGVDIARNEMQARYSFFGGMSDAAPYGVMTNMDMPYVLPQPCLFCVEKIGVAFSPNTKPELRNAIAARYALEFQVGQKIYYRSPLALLFAVTHSEPPVDLPDAAYTDIGDVPLIVEANQFFTATLHGEPLPSNGKARIWVVLKGRRAWGVQ